MKPVLLALAMISTVFAQIQTGRSVGSTGPIGHGFGNVVFPGTGIPSINSAVQLGPSHAERLGATISGRGVFPAAQHPAGAGSYYRQGSRIIPYPVVVPYSYGGGYAPDYGYTGAPPVTVINQMPPTPAVIINQNYTPDRANPVLREYANEDLPVTVYQAPIPSVPEGRKMRDDKPTVYLIALKDGTVYSAYAYWLEVDTLYYITPKHSQNKATLDLVDIALSEQLNRERGLEFKVTR